jgi:hypothetical protein
MKTNMISLISICIQSDYTPNELIHVTCLVLKSMILVMIVSEP